MSLTKAHAKDIKEIAGAIYGLTMILEEDGIREGADGEQAVLGPFEQGTINTAIQHLANQVGMLAEAIEEREQRQGGEA